MPPSRLIMFNIFVLFYGAEDNYVCIYAWLYILYDFEMRVINVIFLPPIPLPEMIFRVHLKMVEILMKLDFI